MLLKRLRLRHFRTYDNLDLRLSAGVSLVHGGNAVGKTNLLEAIYVLATTKSFRTRTDRELIARDIDDGDGQRYARLEGDAETRSGPIRVEMALAEQTSRSPVEASVRKQFRLNGSPKRA
ncbi:MAG: DNA replication and repair protein RecF, partial [Chloroflexi bacterium]